MCGVKRVAVLLTLAMSLTGCSLSRHLERVSAGIEREYASTRTWEQLPLRTISWQQAVAMMRRNNLELLRSRQAVARAQRDTMSVYTDMIPGLSYYGYFSRSLEEIGQSVSSNDVTSNVNVTFSLPALTQVPYRVYAAQATAFAAMKAEEGKERELVSQLYRLVRLRELQERMRQWEKAALEGEDVSAPEALAKAGEGENSHWEEVSRLLGNHEARWCILPESMPRIRWEEVRSRLDRLDPLVICQFAMNLEQARMGQYGVALRYLPTINTNLYSPSLFSSSGGTYQGTFLSTKDTRLNLSISYSLDTTLSNWDHYKQSQENYELARRKVSQELQEHRNKVAMLRRSVDEYENWKRYMQKRMRYLKESPAETGDEYLSRATLLRDMEKELITQEIQSVESEAAVVLEYGMPGSSASLEEVGRKHR